MGGRSPSRRRDVRGTDALNDRTGDSLVAAAEAFRKNRFNFVEGKLMKSIQEEWEEYLAAFSKSEKITGGEREKMKQAFFSGFASVMATLSKINRRDVGKQEAVQWIHERSLESIEFLENIVKRESRRN